MDGNLQYKCPTCRGECYQVWHCFFVFLGEEHFAANIFEFYSLHRPAFMSINQVKDLEDAVQELWRRKDIADRDLIASLMAAAGLPTQEEIFPISPYSDDEDYGAVKPKSESGRSIKFSLKNLSDNYPEKIKDNGKKSSSKRSAKKKDNHTFMMSKSDPRHSFEGHSEIKSLHSLDDDKNDDIQSYRNEAPDVYSSPAAGSMGQSEGSYNVNPPGVFKHKFVDEVMVSDEERKPRVVRIKSNKANNLYSEDETGKHRDKTQNVKGKKLVINLGARKINLTSSPQSDMSGSQREEDLVITNGINLYDVRIFLFLSSQ